MTELLPNKIFVSNKIGELTITWSDCHKSTYTFSLLRFACPCVECRGGHDLMSSEPPGEVFYMPVEDNPTTHLKNIENVGSYGLIIEWEDGHHFGIYDWHYLRALCPCPICREMMIYGK
jgi:DUF971 family protein